MRKRLLLIALMILALGLIGTGLSTLYENDEPIESQQPFPSAAFKVSYGIPLAWHGYSVAYTGWIPWGFLSEYWFSLEYLLLDAAFWFAISFLVCVATLKSVSVLLKTIASKTVVTYFLASASFSIVGVSLFFFGYEDLGFRLYAIGLFLVAATCYQSLVGKRRTSQSSKIAITKS